MIATNPIAQRLSNLEKNFEELKQDLEEIFTDYNDINEDTRAQLDAINLALADLQSNKRRPHTNASDSRPMTDSIYNYTQTLYQVL